MDVSLVVELAGRGAPGRLVDLVRLWMVDG